MNFDLQLVPAFHPGSAALPWAVIGPRQELQQLRALGTSLPNDLVGTTALLLDRSSSSHELGGGQEAHTLETWAVSGKTHRLVQMGVLPDELSRYGAPGRPDQVESLLRRFVSTIVSLREATELSLLLVTTDAEQAMSAAAAVARSLPSLSMKSGAPRRLSIRLTLVSRNGVVNHEHLQSLCDGVRLASRLVDMPAEQLNVAAFVAEARAVAEAAHCDCEVTRGADLAAMGFGGLYGVGRAGQEPPAFVRLEYRPPGANSQGGQAWVGKGIVYDSGGLSLKSNAELRGMKADMAGAAAVLGAFSALQRQGARQRVVALLALAENAIGPSAMRVDDVLTLYSKKTVEITNTDAEGRLALGDAVAYAARHSNVDAIVDLATLTDGAVIATGRQHAAIVTNDGELETRCVQAGRRSGDLVHPLPYCPEFFRQELRSELADLRNSARDPNNANACCAAQFIAEHLGDHPGAWLHVDLEGPARNTEQRGTGFGVALLLELLERCSKQPGA